MNYAPNDEGHDVVRSRASGRSSAPQRPDATLAVVGPDPAPAFQALCAAIASITVTGRVPDVREWLWDSAVGIAPLHVARGVQNKALEAIAAGLPIVITDAVAGGLPPQAMPAVAHRQHAARSSPNRSSVSCSSSPGGTPRHRRVGRPRADSRGRARSNRWCRSSNAPPVPTPRLQSAVAHIAWRSA